jgi:hypothetical protein
MLSFLFLLAGGLWITFVERYNIALSWQSRDWPWVMGHIQGTEILSGTCVGLSNTGTDAPVVRHWKELQLMYTYNVANIHLFGPLLIAAALYVLITQS